MIDFSMTPEQQALRERVRAFVREEMIPREADPRQGPHGPQDDSGLCNFESSGRPSSL